MKKFVSILILILSSFTYQVYAQENSDTRNYVVLTRNIEQMKPILLAAKNLAVEDGSSFGAFQVIICGKAVTDLTNPEKTKEFISLARKIQCSHFCLWVLTRKIQCRHLPTAI